MRAGTAEYLTLEIGSGSTNLHFMVLAWYSRDYGFGKLGYTEFLERLRFQLLVESRNPYLAALGQKKGRQSGRLPNKEALSKRAAKGARIAQSLLLRRKDR